MANYKIEGTTSGECRILVLDDSGQSMLSSTSENGFYSIDGFSTADPKTVIAVATDGEALGYSGVIPIDGTEVYNQTYTTGTANGYCAYWSSAASTIYMHTTTMTVGGNFAGGSRNFIVRFPNVSIPRNAEIQSAYMNLVGNSNYNGNGCRLYMRAEDIGNADAPTSVSDANNLTTTTAVNTWIVPSVSAGVTYSTCSLSAIVQEVIDRPDWNSGNTILIRGMATQVWTGWRAFYTGVYSNSAYHPKLVVQFEA